MSEKFADRFSRLEIPEEKRRIDWGFLEDPLDLPDPLPVIDAPLVVLVNGRALVPGDGSGAGAPNVRFYDQARGLEELDPPDVQERVYREQHQERLAKEQKRFINRAPTSVIREPAVLEDAIDILAGALPEPPPEGDLVITGSGAGALAPISEESLLVTRQIGFSRLLRIHHKLYDLVTLKEYARIFAKAIDPDFFSALQKLPEEVTPEEMLALIADNLDGIHAKARSPLRNKLDSSRVLFNGVTLLPMYADGADALVGGYRALWDHDLKLAALRQTAS